MVARKIGKRAYHVLREFGLKPRLSTGLTRSLVTPEVLRWTDRRLLLRGVSRLRVPNFTACAAIGVAERRVGRPESSLTALEIAACLPWSGPLDWCLSASDGAPG